jgi:hypothetical protein
MQRQNLYLYKPRPKISSYYLLPLANDLFVVFLKTTCTVVRFYRYDIKNERSKRAILAALADAELQKILDATMYNSKSANQIIRETNIPHTTAYRKIKWLVEEKLLRADEIELQMVVRNLACFISY